MLKFTPYSYSKIDCFIQCPAKFKFKYIDKINLFTENKALEKGSRVHEIIEFYQPTKWWKMPSFNYKLLDETEQKEAEKIAIDFVESEFGKFYLLHPGAIGHEIHVGMDRKLQPCNYYAENVMILGKIDFLIKDGRTMYIVDWKTGKVKDQAYMSNDQLMLYSIWVFNMFSDIDEVIADYVYVEHGEKHSFTFKRENYKNFSKNYANKLKNIETEESFPMKTGPLCNWCDYKKQDYCSGK
jgi:ATP-dependent exoDNAse (exonuclease V) beta subunit